MAAPARTAPAPLETELLQRGHEFSFAQAMRLLRLLAPAPSAIRVRPELSLAFPAADVAQIERQDDGYRVTTRFLGLYGSASPLPTFYTEELIDEAREDSSASRDLLDILSQRLFELATAGTAKYRLFFRTVEDESADDLERLFSLAGLGEAELRRSLPEPRRWLRYAGLLGHSPRSALGLQTIIADVLAVPAEVFPCRLRRVAIPPDQRLAVGMTGSTLGTDTVVGGELEDRSGMFLLRLGPLSREQFAAFLPGTPARRTLDLIVELYLDTPLAWDLELTLAPDEAPVASLGPLPGTRLGWNGWLGRPAEGAQASVTFPHHPSQGVTHC
ncbi:type VI secretion system baseplate subunit TssG [Geobacter pickeringii]|uniref:Type VI secretion protein n=1 Tax=Geobacter pickeringii TaxID=345632 RepID=A0A0B5BDH0_9BACT|nr:type VI secretion system baseplate subunit TssG [Geobacter pickeringii]AJE04517.1 type VI secretion protein [Geobacter pickeringii]